MEDGGGIDRRFQGTAYTSSLASPAQSSQCGLELLVRENGAGLGRLWAKSGHNVMFTYSRMPEKLKDLEQEIGSHARPGTPQETVRFAVCTAIVLAYADPTTVHRS